MDCAPAKSLLSRSMTSIGVMTALRSVSAKAGNTTTYPLATAVGAALIDYIKNATSNTDRHVFFRHLGAF